MEKKKRRAGLFDQPLGDHLCNVADVDFYYFITNTHDVVDLCSEFQNLYFARLRSAAPFSLGTFSVEKKMAVVSL
jgi:hypothetical protein